MFVDIAIINCRLRRLLQQVNHQGRSMISPPTKGVSPLPVNHDLDNISATNRTWLELRWRWNGEGKKK